MVCIAPGCAKDIYAKRLCYYHYRHSEPIKLRAAKKKNPDIVRGHNVRRLVRVVGKKGGKTMKLKAEIGSIELLDKIGNRVTFITHVYAKKDVDEAVAELKKRGKNRKVWEAEMKMQNVQYYVLTDVDFEEVLGK